MLLLLFVAAGCATATNGTSPQGAQTGSATQPRGAQASPAAQPTPAQGWTTPKVQQWFVTDTPETLPADKLKKMMTTGTGFGGAY